jgi:lipocalin
MRKTIILILFIPTLMFCKSKKDLPTVKNIDIERYTGLWYEIARLPNSFEKSLECVTARYILKENGKIEVINSGHIIEDRSKIKKAKGIAWIPDIKNNGKLKVRFFWPFKADYYILYLDKDYKYVLVGSPLMKYLWILSRNKKMEEEIYQMLIKKANELEFDTSQIIKVKQDCNQ